MAARLRLRDLIRDVRACRSSAAERKVIQTECARIRSTFKEKVDAGLRPRCIAKLLYVSMLGYPTHFGQVEVLKLCASPKFLDKRIGYLGLMVLLDETQEVLRMVTNSLKKDLKHKSPYVVGLGLCSLGNVASLEIARDLSNEIERLLQSENPYLRKKAALCAARIVRKAPDLAPDFVSHAVRLLSTRNHACLTTGAQLAIAITRVSRRLTAKLRRALRPAARQLRKLAASGMVSEYEVAGICDPFVQCLLVHMLRVVGIRADGTSVDSSIIDVLTVLLIRTDPSKNTGSAILYECVRTAMVLSPEHKAIREHAVTVLGRFLLNRDNNVKYVALKVLCDLRGAPEQFSLQRYRQDIVSCLRHRDETIRRRALDLVPSLATASNATALVRQLLRHLAVSVGRGAALRREDGGFRLLETSSEDYTRLVIERIVSIVAKIPPGAHARLAALLTIVETAGPYTSDSVLADCVAAVGSSKGLQAYAVHRVYHSLRSTSAPSAALTKLALFLIGEYGHLLVSEAGVIDAQAQRTMARAKNRRRGEGPSTAQDRGGNVVKGEIKGTDAAQFEEEHRFECSSGDAIISVIGEIIRKPTVDQRQRAYALNTLLKLSSRLGIGSSGRRGMDIKDQAKLMDEMSLYKQSMNAELQQRSVEYSRLLSMRNSRVLDVIVKPMPVPVRSTRPHMHRGEDGKAGSGDEEMDTEEDTTDDDEDVDENDDDEETTDDSRNADVSHKQDQERKVRFKEKSSPAKESVAQLAPSHTTTATTMATKQLFDYDDDPKTIENGKHVHKDTKPTAASTLSVAPSNTKQKPKDFVLNVHREHGIVVLFQCRSYGLGKFKVRAVCTNNNPHPVTRFDIKIAVPPWMQKSEKKTESVSSMAASDGKTPLSRYYRYYTFTNTHVDDTGAAKKKTVVKVKLAYSILGKKHTPPVATISLLDEPPPTL